MENIQKELFDYSNKIIDRNYKVIYYDCTNYFFYTEENDFQKYGISKQHQPYPLVQMGLFMDADGYPFAMNIKSWKYIRNQNNDPTEKEFLKNYNMKGSNIIICTDAAMCTDELKVLISKMVEVCRDSINKKLNSELQEFALDKKGWRVLGKLDKTYNLEEIEKMNS